MVTSIATRTESYLVDNAFEPSNNQRQVFLSHRYLPKYLSWNVSAGYFVSSRKEHTFRWLLVWNTDNLKIPSDRIIFRPFRSFFQFNSILIFSDLLFLSQERGTCFWLSLLYLLGKKTVAEGNSEVRTTTTNRIKNLNPLYCSGYLIQTLI